VTGRIRAALAGALLAATLAAPLPASAADVTAGELRALAERAAKGDDDARSTLLEVDAVDGRPARVGEALAGARGEDLERRLTAFEGAPAGARPPPGRNPRDEAREILSERRYRPPSVPRPFAGAIGELSDVLAPVGRAIQRALDRVDDVLPGGRAVVWGLLAVLVLLVSGVVASRMVRRRGASAQVRAAAVAGRPLEEPRELEHEADRAERNGDLKLALRLRFRAGLLRLDTRRAIDFRPSLSSGEVSERLHSPTFDGLAKTFDEVAYGGRPAEGGDVVAAREGWPRVLREAAG